MLANVATNPRIALPRLTLLAPLQRSQSGSGAFLGLASDGNQYWVKAPENPQGSRTLIAEVVCYGIANLIGAPVPENALIDIPSNFDWVYAEARHLHGGTAHGSKNIADVIESDDWGTYSSRDDNRRRQALILALWDLCLGVDPQWLHKVTDDYSIWSFDHGFWLAGEVDWTLTSLRQIGMSPWQLDLETDVASATRLHEAATRIEALSLGAIQSITRSVPLEWETTSEEMSELASILFLRVEGVAERLRRAGNQSRHPEGGAP
jgi:hypothetical protein